MKFETHAVLSTSTGRMLGSIDGLYEVIPYLVGRPVYTHELAYYGERAAAALKAALPTLPTEADAAGVTGKNYKDFVSRYTRELGETIDLPDSLRDVLADDRDALSTLRDMVPEDRIVVVDR